MKRKEIIELNAVIEASLKGKCSVRFANGLLHNKSFIKDIVKVHNETMKIVRKPLEKYDEEFEKKRTDLIKKYGTEQSDGSFMIKVGDVNYLTYMDKLTKLGESLDKEYSKEIEEYKKAFGEYEPALDEEVEFKPYKIKLEDFPEGYSNAYHEVLFNAGIVWEGE